MDKYDPNIHHRKSIRLKGYDYSQAGLYFITLCCQHQRCLLGEIVDGGEMVLNDAGKMVNQIWNEIPKIHYVIGINAFVIMPNHIHGICPHHHANGGAIIQTVLNGSIYYNGEKWHIIAAR